MGLLVCNAAVIVGVFMRISDAKATQKPGGMSIPGLSHKPNTVASAADSPYVLNERTTILNLELGKVDVHAATMALGGDSGAEEIDDLWDPIKAVLAPHVSLDLQEIPELCDFEDMVTDQALSSAECVALSEILHT